ncbi:hypothetical protein ACFL5H_03055 [Candidatus Latescibacterota bacterium]
MRSCFYRCIELPVAVITVMGLFFYIGFLCENNPTIPPKRQPSTTAPVPAAVAPVPVSTTQTPQPLPRQEPPVSTVKYDPVAKYGQDRVDAANNVMDLVKQDCNVFVDGGLVVEMSFYVDDRNGLLQYVSAIANADAILYGDTRSIFVYDPSKKMVGTADPFRGIRLRD